MKPVMHSAGVPLLEPGSPFDASDITFESLRRKLQFCNGTFQSCFQQTTLASAFQPIVGLCHERIIGYEGLLRCALGEDTIKPDQLFAETTTLAERIQLDRTARMLHAINFSLIAQDNNWLFLNVHPQVFIHGHRFGAFFKQMLELAGIDPQRIVIEVVESAIEDEERFAEGVMYYRQLGCLIALDSFGARHSNIDRLFRFHPDIVKCDRSLLQRAATDHHARQILARLVALLHEAGIMVVIEGIQTIEQAMIALDTGADFGQGTLFGYPSEQPVAPSTEFDFKLLNNFLQQTRQSQQRNSGELEQITALFRDAAFRCEGDETLTDATLALLASETVLRTYLLNEEGRELDSASSNGLLESLKPQYAPLMNTRDANWGRRPYFRNAIAQPRQLQITAPYRSMSTQRYCRTLSITVEPPEGMRVLCCDIEWDAT